MKQSYYLTRLILLTAMIGLGGCVNQTRYSQIDQQPLWISDQTIDWCQTEACPEFLRKDLYECHLMAMGAKKRQQLAKPDVSIAAPKLSITSLWPF